MNSLRYDILAHGATDVGKARSVNQDAFLIDRDYGLFVVADGMGGHAGGEVASLLCVETIHRQLMQSVSMPESNSTFYEQEYAARLKSAVELASGRIYETSLEQPELRGMGTTATVLWVHENHGFVAHVGDSRLYSLRQGFLYQLTHDHSLVSEQVRAGIISKEEAKDHYLRNVITRSVGYQADEEVDSFVIGLSPGDKYLICSDGLYGLVEDAEISEYLTKYRHESVERLIELANSRGGDDNITVVVIELRAD